MPSIYIYSLVHTTNAHDVAWMHGMHRKRVNILEPEEDVLPCLVHDVAICMQPRTVTGR